MSLNLAGPEGQEILNRLVRKLSGDIFVTNQLPQNYEKLGIVYDIMNVYVGRTH